MIDKGPDLQPPTSPAVTRPLDGGNSQAGVGPAAGARRTWLWQPELIVFVSSGCIMVLELVAGRIIAPYVGVSLYTWTGVIGVVLAGISLGNYLGGWLADRWASLRLLGIVLGLAGLASLGILAVDSIGRLTPASWPIAAEIVALTAALFLLPCLILGTISPIVATLAVRDLKRTGRTLGRIYAAGTVGSIAGTFITGFFLISWFGTHIIVAGVAMVLLSLGLLLYLYRRPALALPPSLMLAAGLVLAVSLGRLSGPCTRQTNYFCIRLHDEERNGHVVRVLTLDRLVHSYTSLDDPTRLVYGYEQAYAELLDYVAEEDDHLRALFIGGGGYTFPRYMEAVYPGSDVHVIEIDPGVTEVAAKWLGLDPHGPIVTYNEDARLFLKREPAETYDIILGDAFNDFSVPYHLTTREFNERVRAWLAPGGYYVLNMIDGPRGNFLRAQIHTLLQTFGHVYVAPTAPNWRQTTRSTFVLVAGDRPLDALAFRGSRAADNYPLLAGQLLSPAEVDEILGEARPVTLTDRYAPVDQMLAPVVREEAAP